MKTRPLLPRLPVLKKRACSTLLVLLVAVAAPAADETESTSPSPEVLLANGFEGWTFRPLKGEAGLEEAWRITDEGVLACTGDPMGYLISDRGFETFTLEFEWRWPGGGREPGNSGLLLSALPAQQGFNGWPLSIEVQLHSGKAGDLYFLGANAGGTVRGEVTVHQGIPVVHVKRREDAEKPVGEWNRMRVTSNAGTVRVLVNGVLVNELTGMKPPMGRIALQSEGAPLEFRHLTVNSH